MNLNIRKFVAATAIVAVGAVSFPFNAAAQDTVVVQPVEQQAVQNNGYVPLRSALNGVGVNVQWVSNNGVQKVVLTYGNQSLDVIVDAANQALSVNGTSFSSQNSNGSLYATRDFYQALFVNATVSLNQAGGISLAAIDASKAITLQAPVAPSAPQESYTYYESGQATWYGSGAQGNYTASGEIFNMYDYTAAHKYLPFGTKVRVTDVNSGKSVIVRINDRGPFGAGRVIDLSYQAASSLGIISQGVANVKLEIVR